MPNGPELVIILIVVLVIFGGSLATKLPKLARSVGQAQNEFKKGQREALEDPERETRETPPAN